MEIRLFSSKIICTMHFKHMLCVYRIISRFNTNDHHKSTLVVARGEIFNCTKLAMCAMLTERRHQETHDEGDVQTSFVCVNTTHITHNICVQHWRTKTVFVSASLVDFSGRTPFMCLCVLWFPNECLFF